MILFLMLTGTHIYNAFFMRNDADTRAFISPWARTYFTLKLPEEYSHSVQNGQIGHRTTTESEIRGDNTACLQDIYFPVCPPDKQVLTILLVLTILF